MNQDAGDLDELGEFEELEELEEVAELEELPAEELPAVEELEELEALPASSGPRELEKAPLMLQKAALVLTVAAVFPWLVPAVDGAFPLERTLAKLVVLLGGYVMYQGVKHRHGEQVPGVLAKLGASNKHALTTLGAVIMVAAIAPLIDRGAPDVMRAIIAKCAVAIGIIVWCQVQDYAKGGKFNPMLGLVIPMFGLGGLGRLLTVFRQFDALALIGSLGVTVAGVLAGYTMFVAMREAKEHGKAKKQAAAEARKQQRQAKRNR